MAKKKVSSIASGRRKRAVARAYIKESAISGKGIVRINGVPVDKIQPELAKLKIEELFLVMDESKIVNYNIDVIVDGGGVMGQIDAARTAIARLIVHYFAKKTLAAKIKEYDRSLLSGDARRVEPKKFGGRKARKRFQKSFR